MDDKLKKALEALEDLHAEVWEHFDPTMQHGDRKQPKRIKKALTDARKAARKLGYKFDGWTR